MNLNFFEVTHRSFVRCLLLFSGTVDISFIDPVVIGRNVFNVTNDFVSGVTGYIQGILSAIMDVILDTVQGICHGF